MTTPSAFTSGPPEFPGLIDASVWIMSTYAPPPSAWPIRFRPVALTTPAVTLGSVLPNKNPYGFPIAIAHSPMMMSSEMKPDPRPAPTRSPDWRPIIQSNGSTGTRSTTSVWTVTTDGATRATASVIAVRRDAETVCGAVEDDFVTVWALESAGLAPRQAAESETQIPTTR